MKLCFNEATTLNNSNLENDLVLCEETCYHFIEIRIDKLKEYLCKHTIDGLKNFFDSHKIKPYAFNALESITFRNKYDYNSIKKDLNFLCEVGVEINCRKIVVVPSFDIKDCSMFDIKWETVNVLDDLASMAYEYGMKLAFEFVGYPNCSVNNFSHAYDIIQTLDRTNVGIVLDCFHFYAMGSKLEDLKIADPQKIFIFHLDDAEDRPLGILRDENRVWPGDGVIDLDQILSTLKYIGYNEMASLELFRPEYWELDPREVITKGKEKMIKILDKYFTIEP